MFIDSVTLTASSGKGGAGAVAFHREKFITEGGPSGGDGGKGGSVYFYVDPNADSLSFYRGKRHFKARSGGPGLNKKKHGKNGEDVVLVVPVGTQVLDAQTEEILLDLVEPDQKVLFLEGGKGGLGNRCFKNPSNQRPTYAQPGLPGQERKVRLELKLIADVGLVGFPNAGKSTLISVISSARPEIGNYPFTTLKPNLGVVDMQDYKSFVVADIPGIIEGASDGKGLGLEFLKHIERTKVLLFCLDGASQLAEIEQYRILRGELDRYSSKLSGADFAVALTKADLFDEQQTQERVEKLSAACGGASFVMTVSSASQLNISTLKQKLFDLVCAAKS